MLLASEVQKSVVQDDLVEAHSAALGIDVELANGLRLVAGLAKLALQRDGMNVVEPYAFFIADSTMPFLGLAGK